MPRGEIVGNVARALALVAILTSMWAALRFGADAQDTGERGAELLSLAVAKVAANEASLQTLRPAELGLIWQVTEARGRTHAARLRWLRAHSSCVLGDRAPVEARGNCSWARNLDDSDDEPEGWPASVPWSRHVERWRQVRTLAHRLVTGRTTLRPCPETPITWGGALDLEGALRRGLRPLRCEDEHGRPTLNIGFARRDAS